MRFAVAALAVALAACTPPASTTLPTEPNTQGEAATTAPAEALTAIQAQLPGFVVTSAASDNATGAQGYRVSGTSGGSTYDVFVLQGGAAWNVATIDREIAWADAPQSVRDAAAAAPNALSPARVVESRQPVDGSIIYKLFATGATDPAMEVRLADGQAAVMPAPH